MWQRLLDALEPQLQAQHSRIEALQRQRWQDSLVRWLKDGLVALFAGLGFAAVGRFGPDRPTLLEIALAPSPHHQHRLDPYYDGMAQEEPSREAPEGPQN